MSTLADENSEIKNAEHIVFTNIDQTVRSKDHFITSDQRTYTVLKLFHVTYPAIF